MANDHARCRARRRRARVPPCCSSPTQSDLVFLGRAPAMREFSRIWALYASGAYRCNQCLHAANASAVRASLAEPYTGVHFNWLCLSPLDKHEACARGCLSDQQLDRLARRGLSAADASAAGQPHAENATEARLCGCGPPKRAFASEKYFAVHAAAAGIVVRTLYPQLPPPSSSASARHVRQVTQVRGRGGGGAGGGAAGASSLRSHTTQATARMRDAWLGLVGAMRARRAVCHLDADDDHDDDSNDINSSSETESSDESGGGGGRRRSPPSPGRSTTKTTKQTSTTATTTTNQTPRRYNLDSANNL